MFLFIHVYLHFDFALKYCYEYGKTMHWKDVFKYSQLNLATDEKMFFVAEMHISCRAIQFV